MTDSLSSLAKLADDLDADGQPAYAWRVREEAKRIAAELDHRALPAVEAPATELTASTDAPIFDAVHDDLGITPDNDEETK